MGPLVRVIYSGLIQSVFRLDRVKSSSCDCPEKIPVDSNASCFSCFTCFSSGSSSPEDAEFCPTCAWCMVSLRPKPPLAHYPEFIVYLATILFKSSFTSEKLSCFVTAFKDLYLSRVPKNLIIIPQATHQALGMCFHV
jgi:hypothetical protein